MPAKSCLGRAPESFRKYRMWRVFDLLEGFEEVEEYSQEVQGKPVAAEPEGDNASGPGMASEAPATSQERGRTRIATPDFQARNSSSRR